MIIFNINILRKKLKIYISINDYLIKNYLLSIVYIRSKSSKFLYFSFFIK